MKKPKKTRTHKENNFINTGKQMKTHRNRNSNTHTHPHKWIEGQTNKQLLYLHIYTHSERQEH